MFNVQRFKESLQDGDVTAIRKKTNKHLKQNAENLNDKKVNIEKEYFKVEWSMKYLCEMQTKIFISLRDIIQSNREQF